MMFATYNPTQPEKELNVRKEPNAKAEVVRTMVCGQTEEVEVVERGWCKLSDGYIDARFVTVEADALATAEVEQGHAEDGQGQVDAGEPESGNETAEEAEVPADAAVAVEVEQGRPSYDAETLRSMKKEDLVKLAEGSGIKVKGNMPKDDLIEAILADIDG